MRIIHAALSLPVCLGMGLRHEVPEARLELNEIRAKPAVTREIAQHMPHFISRAPEKLIDCRSVADAIGSSSYAYLPFQTILHLLHPKAQEANDHSVLERDKTVQAAFLDLGANMLRGADHQDRGLLDHIGKVINCYVDEKNGRTIFQSLWQYGLVMSLQTPLVQQLFAPVSQFANPYLELDRNGNTLLHIVVESCRPALLINFENQLRKFGKYHAAQYAFYMLSAMNWKNSDGMRPLDLAVGSMVKPLRDRFRNLVTFAKALTLDQQYSSSTMRELSAAMAAAQVG